MYTFNASDQTFQSFDNFYRKRLNSKIPLYSDHIIVHNTVRIELSCDFVTMFSGNGQTTGQNLLQFSNNEEMVTVSSLNPENSKIRHFICKSKYKWQFNSNINGNKYKWHQTRRLIKTATL